MTSFKTNPLKHISETQWEILSILREIRLKPEGDFLVDMKQASQFLGVVVPTLRRYVKEGKIKAVEVGGEIKFWNKDLVSFLKPIN